MADFINDFWSVYIAILVALSIIGCGVLLWSQSKVQVTVPKDGKVETTGHVYDGLEEFNNPMPRWWMWLFYITIVFAIIYLALYPGFGSFAGKLGWHSAGQYREEVKLAEAEVGPMFEKYKATDLKALAADSKANAMGERLFLTYCAQCHGSDARGNKGFPNLADRDWLYGGEPETIKLSILNGRHGQMPPMGAAVGSEKDIESVAHYVLSLSGSAHDSIKATAGREKFAVCAACHGADGKGMEAMGAPNLTDKTWLYGGSVATIMETIRLGRNNVMPAFADFLGEAKVHLLAAYVWGLSNKQDNAVAAK
ncbi:MAG: cytochrome-c oxidase, cbb3-type subunit III [Burkholderiales bacterium]|jgi:cytochrome c oxidase cbb3-type subunit III|nr:cytochrome-c oxidase, cbb3-type subunit III [Burkholderiales bacterium]